MGGKTRRNLDSITHDLDMWEKRVGERVDGRYMTTRGENKMKYELEQGGTSSGGKDGRAWKITTPNRWPSAHRLMQKPTMAGRDESGVQSPDPRDS